MEKFSSSYPLGKARLMLTSHGCWAMERSGLDANYSSDAALTRFVYCLALSVVKLWHVPPATIVFLNPRAHSLLTQLTRLQFVRLFSCNNNRMHCLLWPCAVTLLKSICSMLIGRTTFAYVISSEFIETYTNKKLPSVVNLYHVLSCLVCLSQNRTTISTFHLYFLLTHKNTKEPQVYFPQNVV